MINKKIPILLYLTIVSLIYASVILPDYKLDLPFDIDEQYDKKDKEEIYNKLFSFNFSNIPGDLIILGNWNIKLGYGTGFVLYPELMWLVNVPNMKEGVIFEQERLFSLDWTTDEGIKLHLFFNDDLDQTEFSFKYNVSKIFNSIYITNRFNNIKVNPYRNMKGGKVTDINFGFDWGYKFYKGRFDIQFDSAKKVNDTFRGNSKFLQNKIYSSSFVRGIYYYLPDKNITSTLEVYLSDDNGEKIDGLPDDFTEARKYKILHEETDFKINSESGLITFKESIFNKTLLIYYKTNVNGNLYEAGDTNAGKNGVYGLKDFNKETDKNYFVTINNKRFLILSFKNNYTYFEEKNSYKIAANGTNASDLNLSLFDSNNIKMSGFQYSYDNYTGSIRITKSTIPKDLYNIYPFYDSVSNKEFYLNNTTPKESESKNLISYDCLLSSDNLKLSEKPVNGSITVFLNSIELESKYYNYDYTTQTISLTLEIKDTDIIDVYYIADESDSYNLTAALINEFKLNNYLLLSDSLWYKMPIKLWENSYYNKLHSGELLYNITFAGNFKEFLLDNKTGKLSFETNATLSLFIPELKGVTIVEDFEQELEGYSLNLEYKNYFPVTIPKLIYPKILNNATCGKLFFCNTHTQGITTNGSYVSLYNNPPEKDDYSDSNRIGPYSSCDGYYGEKNTLSLVTDFELNANQAVSIAIPLSNDQYNYTNFFQVVTAIKSMNLEGTVNIFLDAGLISEQFTNGNTTIQTETLDEGIKYLIDDKFYLYKGKNDGLNQTNDFDNNGILDADDITEITPFKYFESFDNSSDYLTLNSGESKIANFRIINAGKLKNIRGFRLTIYSQNGAKGKLIINQLRFTESGFTQEIGKNSYAEEIFPAEDDVLIKNIFSQKNSDFDKKLHYQREKERTLRVRLKNNEELSISKKYSTPIDIRYFKKIGLFIFLKNDSNKTLSISLLDSKGNTLKKKVNLSDYKSMEWHNIAFNIKDFDNYSRSNKVVTQIGFDFINENNIDITDNDVFIDEVYMEESEVFAGFSNKNEFIYEDNKIDFKTKKGFSIFSSPKIRITTLFTTNNFLIDEMKMQNNYQLNIDSALSFKFLSTDFSILYDNDIIFQSKVYTPNESFQLKIEKSADKSNPLIFGLTYDYKKNGTLDSANILNLGSSNQNRKFVSDIGFKISNISLIVGHDIDSVKGDNLYTYSKYKAEFKLSYEKVNFGIIYNIYNKRERKSLSGSNSMDNFIYLFSEDFISFFYEGDNKYQYFNMKSNFQLFNNIDFTNTIDFKDNGLKGTSDFTFDTKYDNKSTLDIKVSFSGTTKSFFNIEYYRTVENSYIREYSSIDWQDYFNNFSNSFCYITPLMFFPPFSSLYRKNEKVIFGENYRFANLKDSVKLYFDWSIFLIKSYFLPYKFTLSLLESVVNTVIYSPDYTITFALNGKGERSTPYFKNITLNYALTETINLKSSEKNFKTETNVVLNLYLFNNIDIENSFSYIINYTEAIIKKEFNHNISFITKFYKDFYKTNFVTNDKEGIDLTISMEYASIFYNRLNGISDMLDNPLKIYLTPQFGYRFNKNFKIQGTTKFGYSLDYSQTLNVFKNNFAFEFYIEGKITF